jgi:hypothetical protein
MPDGDRFPERRGVGLITYYVLFFIDIASRSVHIAGITPHPDNRWMKRIARNVTDAEDGILRGTRYLILDRDTKYSDEFRNAFVREGIHLVRLPVLRNYSRRASVSQSRDP